MQYQNLSSTKYLKKCQDISLIKLPQIKNKHKRIQKS